MFVIKWSVLSSLVTIAGKARSLPVAYNLVEHLLSTQLLGKLLVLSENIRLSW